MNDTTIVALAGLVISVGGFVGQYIREGRNRKWIIEDRELTRRELANTAHEVKGELVTAAKDVKDTLEKSTVEATKERKEIAGKHEALIKENTEISTKAFTEANHVNVKILDLKKDTEHARQRIEDVISIFDKVGVIPLVPAVAPPTEATSVVINSDNVKVETENVMVGQKPKDNAKQ